MKQNYDQWLTKQPDREAEAARATLLDCQSAKRKVRCMDEWVQLDRIERRAQAFLAS